MASCIQNNINPPRNLASFPEEILLCIFHAIHDTPIPQAREDNLDYENSGPFEMGIQGIQNVRLTCRKFNRIGSECLIRIVRVDLNPESLARFKEIMGHPVLGRAVRVVRIRLAVYDEALNGKDAFAREIGDRLDRFVQRSQSSSETKRLAERYASTNPPKELNAAFSSAYREFRRRSLAQQSILEKLFVEGVANAMRMRTARTPLRLEITDQNDLEKPEDLLPDEVSPDNLLDVILAPRPSTWDEIKLIRRETVPSHIVWLLPRVLAAFADDRTRIDDLFIEISCNNTSDPEEFRQVDRQVIRAAMRNLRSFTYIGEFWSKYIAEGSILRSILYECLPSVSLQSLELQEVSLQSPELQEVSLQQHWQLPNLSKIYLMGVCIDADTLSHLLQPLPPHSLAISLHHCSVVQDRWADVLDLLRSNQPHSISLVRPHGQEFYDQQHHSFAEWYANVRGHYRACIRMAQEYIKGWSDINPLRKSSM